MSDAQIGLAVATPIIVGFAGLMYRNSEIEETGVAAGFRWHHAPGTDELVLSTPFGQALARLSGDADGVVLEKKAVQGVRFMPGEVLYLIADLSQVWLIAEVFEQDIGRLRPGQRARIGFDAYPGQVFEGRVAAILPVLQYSVIASPLFSR